MSPLVVHLVGGVDVAAIVGPVVTGVVAIAGILATARQARRGRESDKENLQRSLGTTTDNQRMGLAEDRRQALRAEKLMAYTHCLSALHLGLLERMRVPKDPDKDGLAIIEATNGVTTVQLIAPREICMLASRTLQALLACSPEAGTDPFTTLEAELNQAMRKDLLGSEYGDVPVPRAAVPAAKDQSAQ